MEDFCDILEELIAQDSQTDSSASSLSLYKFQDDSEEGSRALHEDHNYTVQEHHVDKATGQLMEVPDHSSNNDIVVQQVEETNAGNQDQPGLSNPASVTKEQVCDTAVKVKVEEDDDIIIENDEKVPLWSFVFS